MRTALRVPVPAFAAMLVVLGVAFPTAARAQNVCNGLINLNYVSGPMFALAGDTYRVQASLGAGSITGGAMNELTVTGLRFELDCQIFGFVGCANEGDIIRYVSDATITSSNCLDSGAASVSWTSDGVDSPVGPNQVLFTPSAPAVIAANTLPAAGCVIEFDVRVQTTPGLDASPLIVQEAVGYNPGLPADATCDNGLQSTASQSGQIRLCPACVNDQCFTQACNQNTGMCDQTDEAPSTACEADGDLCTNDHCDGNGTCVFESNVVCQAANPPCEGGELCNPSTGMCDPQPDGMVSTACEADGDLCTNDHCDGNGTCVLESNVVCQAANPPCEGGELCNPSTGMCDPQPDGMVSTACEADGNLCTNDHCDGNGACIFQNNVVCQPASPPCEGGAICNPGTGMCDPQPDANVSTTCELDGNLCTNDHCDGNGACVFQNNVVCQPASPPCEGGAICNPGTGMCDPQPDGNISTPCNADADLCTTDHCDGSGACVFQSNVTCQDPAGTCEAGEACNPQTGQCDPQGDADPSTPCEEDGDLCTEEHCDGSGNCVFLNDVTCAAPAPPCDGGETCNPNTGACDPEPDAQVSTPCEADGDQCSIDHCDGAGNCVFLESTGEPECFGDHFKCYRTNQLGTKFVPRDVELVDQFLGTTTKVQKPLRFCNPVDKNGEGIEDPTAHLMCYKIKEPRFSKRNVEVTNQFGTQRLTVNRPDSLCLPAGKDDIPIETDINHVKCYKVRPARGEPKFQQQLVTLDDQFESKLTEVVKPRFLCNPVDKNGEGVPDPGSHLVCYRIDDAPGEPGFVRVQADILDQFGEQDLNTLRGDCRKASFLCLPSAKRELSPSGAFLEMSGALVE